jgi:hypothetical protein
VHENNNGIRNYTINNDGSIDVDGSVNLNNRDLSKLLLNFRDFYFNKNSVNSVIYTWINIALEEIEKYYKIIE